MRRPKFEMHTGAGRRGRARFRAASCWWLFGTSTLWLCRSTATVAWQEETSVQVEWRLAMLCEQRCAALI